MATERANAPEHMRELFALTIDRSVSAEVSKINKEVGKSISLSGWQASQSDIYALAHNLDLGYHYLLTEYVQLKLILHRTRRSAYYRGDLYTEREDIDIKKVRERCTELREMIKAKRGATLYAAWGDLIPLPKPTPYDKPILHAMDEHTCSFILEENEDEDCVQRCPLQGSHWFYGSPYCRRHMRTARREFNQRRNQKKLEEQGRRIWSHCKEPDCSFGRPIY